MGTQSALRDRAARQAVGAVLARHAQHDNSTEQPLCGPAWHGPAQQAVLEAQQAQQMDDAGLGLGGGRMADLCQAAAVLGGVNPLSASLPEYTAALAAAAAATGATAASLTGAAGNLAIPRYAPGADSAAAAVSSVADRGAAAKGGRRQPPDPAMLAVLVRMGYQTTHFNGC